MNKLVGTSLSKYRPIWKSWSVIIEWWVVSGRWGFNKGGIVKI